jgi:hypothetical protein
LIKRKIAFLDQSIITARPSKDDAVYRRIPGKEIDVDGISTIFMGYLNISLLCINLRKLICCCFD